MLDSTAPGQEWCAGLTVVDVVNDDMPFLVDSVRAALNSLDGSIDLIVHPVIQVVRDAEGQLGGFVDGQETAVSSNPESLIHIELVGAIDAVGAARIRETIEHVLLDVRAVVVDWAPMVKLTQAAADGLGTPGLPVAATEASEVAALLTG